MKESSNSRVAESQKRIGAAMLELLEFESYQKITITQLIQHAEVSRKTFYRNFDNKDDTLSYLLNKVFKELAERILKIKELSNTEITNCYFDVWYLNSTLLKVLMKNDLMHIVYKFHSDKIKKLYELFYCPFYQNRDDYWNAIIIDTYYSMLEQWTKDNFELSPNDIAHLYTIVIEDLGVSK